MFDKYTDRAKRVLMFAQEEARRFDHDYIGTEHLLLGLVREGEGIAGKVLYDLGVDLTKTRSAVEFIIGRGKGASGDNISLTPRGKKVIELAAQEARALGHGYIDTEHLLLGLLREGEGIAIGMLESLGVSLEELQSRVLPLVGQGEEASNEERIARDRRTEEARISLTPRANRVLRLAANEARELGHEHIGTGHILLALVREGEGVAASVLKNLGVSLKKTRQQVIQAVSQGELL
jgi:ATP-dependent Clp protease ATP-binding subunit ClpC